MTRSGEPPRTAAVTGSSTGSNGEFTSETTVRSACLPGTSDPISVVHSENAGAAERRELERIGGRQRIRPARAGAGADDRRSDLLEQVERRRRGGAVGRDRDRRRPPSAAPRAARRRSRGSRSSVDSARRRRRAAARSVDLLGVGVDAMRRHQARARAVPPPPAGGSRSRPDGGTRNSASGLQSPVPSTSQSRSAALSAKWVACGSPSSAQAR